jgi:hypothetical protein
MTSQQQADTLLAVWQRLRAQNENRTDAELERQLDLEIEAIRREMAPIRQAIERRS